MIIYVAALNRFLLQCSGMLVRKGEVINVDCILCICLSWSLLSSEETDGILESLWEKPVGPEGGLSIMQIRDKHRPNLLLQML